MRKLKKLSSILGILLLTLVSCNKFEEDWAKKPKQHASISPQLSDLNDLSAYDKQVILLQKLENPYSITNLGRAAKTLGFRSDSTSIAPTHLYVRFLPDNLEEMEKLHNDELKIYTYPLDYEISETGSYYHDPSIPEDKLTWMYTIVPTDYFFPNVRYEILERIALLDENEEQSGRIVKKSFELTHNKYSTGQLRSWKPQGTILVDNNIGGKTVPLKNVRVRIRNWFNINDVFTNENGTFISSNSYANSSNVDIKLIFRNDKFIMRSTLIWFFDTCQERIMNEMSKSGNNFTFTIEKFPYSKGNSVSLWGWAIICNAFEDYTEMAVKSGVNAPPRLKIWANANGRNSLNWMGSGSGATLMMNSFVGTGGNYLPPSNFWNFLANVLYIPIANFPILQQAMNLFLPDMILSYSTDVNTGIISSKGLTRLCFHELGHASHFTKAKSFYWQHYINYIIANMGYGDGTGTDSGLCALGESWAEYASCVLMLKKYPSEDWYLINSPNTGIENMVPVAGTDDWLPLGILYDLEDNGELSPNTNIIDNVDSYTIEEVFNRLGTNVTSLEEHRDDLLNTTNNPTSGSVFRLYASYGFP